MIRFLDDSAGRSGPVSRREWLRIGGLGLAGWGLGTGARALAQGEQPSLPGFGRAKSVIVVFANGGQSQLEMWDPKPDAPSAIRGEFNSIPTAIPGVRFGEHMPKIARIADKMTVIRSVSHDDLDHGSAVYLSLTGRFHTQKSANPPPSPTDFPCLGAVLKRIRPSRTLPYTSIHVNGPALVPELIGPGQDGGILGREFEPMVIGDVSRDPAALPDLTPPLDLPPVRRHARQSLLQSVDTYRRDLTENKRFSDMDGLYRKAHDLLASRKVCEAFRIGDEPASIRERYGMHRSGQACLLARRLAEAEIPLITVMWNHSGRGQDTHPDDPEYYGWDTHNDIFDVMKNHLVPRFDQSFSALLEDMDSRGLLDQTLVVCMGEFGRAPRVALEPKFSGATPGRKHWAGTYSIAMAGAGVTRGAVFGESDKIAAYPKSDRVGPWDVLATILSSLGVDHQAEYRDTLDRPFAATIGSPIAGLYRG